MRDPVYQLLNEIAAERMRQEEAEGFTLAHDDSHDLGELAAAAAAYALGAIGDRLPPGHAVNQARIGIGPWPLKPQPPRRMLVVACALLLAEIERIDRRDGRRTALDRTEATPRRFDRVRAAAASAAPPDRVLP